MPFDAASSDGTAGSSASLTVSHTTGSGSDRYMQIGVTHEMPAGSSVLSSVTVNGSSTGVTLLESGSFDNTIAYHLYELKAPSTGTYNVVANVSTNTWISLATVTYSGVDQTTPAGTVAEASNFGTAPTVNVTSVSGDTVVDFLFWQSAGVRTATKHASQTERTNSYDASDIYCTGASEEVAASGTTTMSWTLSADSHWAIVGVALKAAAGGGGPVYRTISTMRVPNLIM